jgi:exodeoxyribonuclease III
MKIINWNCNMAYRNKAKYILNLNPDIVVVPESETTGNQTQKRLWFGNNPQKGISIYSYSEYSLQIHQLYNPEYRYVIPLEVTGKSKFYLLAIWAMNDKQDRSRRYIGQVWLALNYYKELLNKPMIIIGDFNSNMKWDRKGHYGLCGKFGDVVNLLQDDSIHSAYHQYFKENFGMETRHTWFMYRHEAKQYHIDYCFASSNFKVNLVEIGKYEEWSKYSDHMPLTVTFEEQ